MLRSAFAHDSLSPTWECRGPFRARYTVPSIGLDFDGAALDGARLKPADVGGIAVLMKLVAYCVEVLERNT